MWYLPHSHVHNERTVPIIMAGCMAHARLYFHFQSKIWRRRRVPWPQFPLRRGNFRNLCTFKADIGLLNICIGFPKMGVLGDKIGERVVQYWPLTNSFFFLGVLTSVPIYIQKFIAAMFVAMARYILSYRISRYWGRIVAYLYRDNHPLNEVDILHNSQSR